MFKWIRKFFGNILTLLLLTTGLAFSAAPQMWKISGIDISTINPASKVGMDQICDENLANCASLPLAGSGDMLKSVYDPTNISASPFARVNHTGTQPASTISDFDTEVSNNSSVVANTAKVTNATHTGDVTGSSVLSIALDAIKDTMIDWGIGTGQVSTADIPEQTNLYYTEGRVSANSSVVANTAKISYPSADSTKVGFLSVTQAVNLDTIESDTATNNAKISFDAISSARLANTSGTNTGDQTTIAGITGTKSQFDTAVTDGNFMYSGDSITASLVSDFDTEVSNNSSVVANTAKISYPSADATKVGFLSITQAVNLDTLESDTATNNAKVTNATHSGDVTGDTALTIATGAVDLGMLSATGTPSSSTFLRGDNTWSVPAGTGDVSKVGTPVDNQIGVWTGDGTIEGTINLTYTGSNLQFAGDLGSTGTRITKGWLTDLTVTNAITGSVTGNAGTVTNGAYTTNNLSVFSATTSAQLAGVLSDETGSGNTVFSTNPLFGGYLDIPEISTPANPSANVMRLYSKDDAGTTKIYVRDSAGTETNLLTTGGTGDVVGPSSSVDDRIATFDLTTGKIIQDGGSTIADVLSRSNHTGAEGTSAVTSATADSAPTTDDIIMSINDPLGTPGTRKVTLDNLSKGLNTSNLPNAPNGGIAAVTTQAAINELDTEKATIALSNLASVAINTNLVSDTAGTDSLGTEILYWLKGFFGSELSFEGSTDDDYQTTFSITNPTLSDKTITFQNANGIVAMDETAVTNLEGTKLSITAGTLNVTETDSVVGAVTGIVKSNGAGTISGGSSIDDLSDVDTTTVPPTVDQNLTWNGSNWTPKNTPIGASTGKSFYSDNTSIIPASAENTLNVETLTIAPSGGAEVVESANVTNNTVAIDAYLDGSLGITQIPAGVWDFETYASVSSVLSGRVSTITRGIYQVVVDSVNTVTTTGTGTSRTVTSSGGTPFSSGDSNADQTLAGYVQTPKGLYQITGYTSPTVVTISVPTGYVNEVGVSLSKWKYLFKSTTNTIVNLTTNYGDYRHTSVQPAFTISITDKLGTIVFATSNNTTTVNYVYEGQEHYSHFTAPLTTSHNDLPMLQGGAANELYHLTSAQHTISTQAATTSLSGYLTSTDWNTFNGKENSLTFSNGVTRTGNAVANDLLTGKAGGQTITGGTATGDDITFESTTNATKGDYVFNGSTSILKMVSGLFSSDNDIVLDSIDTVADSTVYIRNSDATYKVDLDIEDDVFIHGDLTVDGVTNSLTYVDMEVTDKNITLAKVAVPSDSIADGGGLTVKGTTDKTFLWDNVNDNFTSNQNLNITTGLDYKINNVSVLNSTTLGSSITGSSLTGLGTVTSGTLSTGAVIGGVTMTLGSDAAGDIYYRNSSGILTRLAKGSDTQVLTLASGLPSWATPSGLTWGGSITGSTGTGLSILGTSTRDASLLVDGVYVNTYGDTSISANNWTTATQAVALGSSFLTGVNWNTNSSYSWSNIFVVNQTNTGGGTNTGIKVANYSTEFSAGSTYGAGVFSTQYGGGGVAIAAYGYDNTNSATHGLVNYTLSNTQSGPTVMQKIDTSTTTQPHTGTLVQLYNANATAKAFNAQLSTTGTGIAYNADTSALSGEGRLLQLTHSASGILTANISSQAYIETSRTNTASSGSVTDNYRSFYITRQSRNNDAGGTFISQGSVLKLENVATQTAGTLTDTVAVLELVQDLDSTGDIITASGNGGSTNNFTLSRTGNLGIGITADATSRINASSTIADNSSNPFAYNFISIFNATAGNVTGIESGASFVSYANTNASPTYYDHTSVRAIGGSVYNLGKGLATTLYGLQFTGGILDSGNVTTMNLADLSLFGTGAGKITNANGLKIASMNSYHSDATTVSAGINLSANVSATGLTKYGIYIGGISGASSGNYSIYSVSGLNYFGANIGVGEPNPTTGIDLVGTSSRSTIQTTRYTATASSAPYLNFRRARGSSAIPTVVNQNDNLGLFYFYGWKDEMPEGRAAEFVPAAGFGGGVENDSATDHLVKGFIFFKTNNVGDFTTDGTEKLRITNAGRLGSMTTAPDKQVEINSTTGDALRLTYNDSNGSATHYSDFTVSSAGILSISPSGVRADITKPIVVNGTISTSSQGIVSAKKTADPCGDTTNFPEASQFYNDTSNYMCYCDGSGVDKKISDDSACF